MTQNLLQDGIKIEIKLALSDAAFWAWLWVTYFEALFSLYQTFAPFLHAHLSAFVWPLGGAKNNASKQVIVSLNPEIIHPSDQTLLKYINFVLLNRAWRPLVLFYSCKLYLFKADSTFINFLGLLMFMFFRILIQKTHFED